MGDVSREKRKEEVNRVPIYRFIGIKIESDKHRLSKKCQEKAIDYTKNEFD